MLLSEILSEEKLKSSFASEELDFLIRAEKRQNRILGKIDEKFNKFYPPQQKKRNNESSENEMKEKNEKLGKFFFSFLSKIQQDKKSKKTSI